MYLSLSLRNAISNIQRGGTIPSTTNITYEITKLGGQDDHLYEVIDEYPETNPCRVEGHYQIPHLPPSHQLHPSNLPTVSPSNGDE